MDTLRVFGEHTLAANVETVLLDETVPEQEVWEPEFFVLHRHQGSGILTGDVTYTPAESSIAFLLYGLKIDQE